MRPHLETRKGAAAQGQVQAPQWVRSARGSLTAALLIGIGLPGWASAQVVRDDFVVANGPVHAALLAGNTLIRPNPFRTSAHLSFWLARSATVTMTVYDVAGREVARPLIGARLGPGTHGLALDGRGLASGVYLCRLQVGSSVLSRRVVHCR